MPDHNRLPASVRVLVQGQFGLFFVGNGLSLVGTWMQRIACSWLVWDWTGSAFWLGILAAGDLLPVVIVGPFAGVAADRWDRLRLNKIAQVISAGLAILMALLLSADRLGLLGVVFLVTLQGTVVAAIQPARLAMVQQMVPRADMGTAVALNSVNVNFARVLGPAIAGTMILHLDILWIFVANAVVTLLLVAILSRLRLAPQQMRTQATAFLHDMAEGFAYVLQGPALRLILLVMLCGGIAVRAMLELLPAIAAQTFSVTATGLAVLTGAAAVGAVASGLTVGAARPSRLLYGVMACWAIGGMAAVALTQAHFPLLAIGTALILGASITRGLIWTQTFVQMTTPDVLRGRALSVHGLIARGSPAIGALGIGYAADQIGLAASVAVSSLCLLVVLVLLLPVVRRVAARIEDAP